MVRTDENGEIIAGLIDTTSGSTTNTITKVYATYSGDSYIRYCTPNHLADAMTNVLKNTTDTAITSSDGNTRLYFGNNGNTIITSYDQLIFRTNNASTDVGTISTGGNLTMTGNVTAYSDINLKKNIEVIPNAIDKVSSLRGVTYNRIDIDGNPRQCGVIAQEVEKVCPEVVSTGEDGIKSVAYGNMVGLLIEAVKEQQVQINKLQEKLNDLEGK